MKKRKLSEKTQSFSLKNKKYSNPCTRCGKERVSLKSWNETITNFMNTTEVTYTETICPDKECQKLVEKELEAQRKKKEELGLNRKNRLKKPNRVSISITKPSKK